MQYRIVTSYNSRELSEIITRMLNEGWLPQGGVCFVLGTMNNYYMQAMIKHG